MLVFRPFVVLAGAAIDVLDQFRVRDLGPDLVAGTFFPLFPFFPARVFGSLLTWLNDHESDVFFVGTCNDAAKLPPEFARAERFDGVFFVDLPGREQKDGIWGIYQQHYGLDPRQPKPDDSQWTGAEIKSYCRLAALLDVPLVQVAQNVVPVAVTAGGKIESLRQWASGRCLSADRAGVYARSEVGSGRGRSVMRGPGVN